MKKQLTKQLIKREYVDLSVSGGIFSFEVTNELSQTFNGEFDFSFLNDIQLNNAAISIIAILAKLGDDLEVYIDNWDNGPLKDRLEMREPMIDVSIGSAIAFIERFHAGTVQAYGQKKQKELN